MHGCTTSQNDSQALISTSMDSITLIFLLQIIFCQWDYCSGFKFLILAGDISSHMFFNAKLAVGIAERGHHVDFVTSKLVKPPDYLQVMDNVTLKQYHAEGPALLSTEDEMKPYLEFALKPSLANQAAAIDYSMRRWEEFSKWILDDSEFIDSLDAEKYDFAVVDIINPRSSVIPYRLDIPSALLSPIGLRNYRRSPELPSYVPNFLSSFLHPTGFWGRVGNLIGFVMEDLFGSTLLNTEISAEFAPNRPALSELELFRRIDIFIGLRDETLDYVKPRMPDMATMAHLLVSKAKTLPAELQEYVDTSQHGVIVVSFGSWIDNLPDEVLGKLLKAFSTMKQKFIFKLRSNLIKHLTDVPSNVKVMSWIPQADLLAHPGVKLFITHAGVNSMAEAVYHKVPMLAMPVAFDQHYNAAIVTTKGYGETLYLGTFTADELVSTARKIINNPKYHENVLKASEIYRDIQESGISNPVILMEHVIQHGSAHLRSSAYDLYFYEYYMIDVWVAIVVLCFTVVMVMYKVCRACCCRKRINSNKNKLE